MESIDRYIKCKKLHEEKFPEYFLGNIDADCNYKNVKPEKKYETFIFYHEFNILVVLDAFCGDACFYTSEDDKFTTKVKLIV
ncbi:MAG: tenascin-R [Caudoviricetes sp.]|nr:MAG: tenascin-R [Caudoviricetes sp.]